MKIFINDIEKDVDIDISVSDLISQLGIFHQKGIAVSINGEIIPAADWPLKNLKEKDNILIIKAIQGG